MVWGTVRVKMIVNVGRADGGNVGRIDQEKGIGIVKKNGEKTQKLQGKRGKGKHEAPRLKLE
jgi:hypothetical protein